jgi:hypothetical protein
VLDVNLMGVVHGIRTFLPHIRAHGERDHIVNTAAWAGIQSGLGFSPYATSKFAVVGMSEGLAMKVCASCRLWRIGSSGRYFDPARHQHQRAFLAHIGSVILELRSSRFGSRRGDHGHHRENQNFGGVAARRRGSPANIGDNREFTAGPQGGAPENGDKYARSLTWKRLHNAITGERPSGNGAEPLGGGFEFRMLTRQIDAKTVLSMKKSELVDVVITSHWDENRRGSPNLVRIEDPKYTYLLGKDDRGEGYFIIWNHGGPVGQLDP